MFEDHILPEGWRRDLNSTRAAELAPTLDRLRRTAATVVAAALDASIAREGSKRLAELVPPAERST